jgi:hypothetical protein
MSSTARVEALFTELGIQDRVTKVAENVWTLQKGSATIQIVAAPEFVVATSKVAERLPTGNREAFFRMLLAANVQLLGAFFTLESNETIRINQAFPIDSMQARELAFIIGNVAKQADDWDDRLKAHLGQA